MKVVYNNWKTEYCDKEVGIYLRPMTYDDTDYIVNWRNSEAVKRNFIYRGEFTKSGHENWIKTQIETGLVVQFVVCDIDTDAPLGSTYLRDIDKHHNKAEFGIFIGESSARGRGVGIASTKLTIRYGFEKMELHRLYLRVLSENIQASHCYEKAGFKSEGLFKEDVYLDGRYCDVIRMAILNQ